MAISFASAQKAFLSCGRAGMLALAIGLAAPASQAANPGDWWVYVANDYPDDIKALLAQGSDPNVRYKNGQPAIMRAVVDGAWKVFDVLAADKRTDVNAENPAGETPLMYLAIAGQTERARKLIARGANVNRLGWTPLHYAASRGQMEMARLLLANKAMVNAPAPNGETPLMMAALSGRKPMVDLLIKSGADITTQDTKGQDAAAWATTAPKSCWMCWARTSAPNWCPAARTTSRSRRAKSPSGRTSCRISTCSTRCGMALRPPRSPSWPGRPGATASPAHGPRPATLCATSTTWRPSSAT